MLNSNGIVIILSYPDTIVRHAHWEFSSKLSPLLGIGNKNTVRAGHSALLLISKNKPEINYFDFGRYTTAYGNGRVRSKDTDPEVSIPIEADFKNGILKNLDDILLWLDKHPEKTHGNGRLIASINSDVDYNKAASFIQNLIQQKEIPYGAFLKKGTNCARFVADVLIKSCNEKTIQRKLKMSYLLTPSPIGNVIKGKTEREIYQVKNQKLKEYTNRYIIKEYNAFLSKKLNTKLNLIGTEFPDKTIFDLENGTWLSGIGSGSWFRIEKKLTKWNYSIAKYNFKGEKEFEDVFHINNTFFDIKKEYEFIHPTNYLEASIKQGKKEYLLKRK